MLLGTQSTRYFPQFELLFVMPPNGNSRDGNASEVTPLLASSVAVPSQDPDVAEALVASPATEVGDTRAASGEKPLPKRQIMLLCYARLVEPIAFFSIFPFINQMIERNSDLPKADVGFYTGLIESLFSLTQMMVMIFWGRASDRLGRKPVLVFSLIGVAISTGIFGMARNLWQMILFRCLAGVFAGTIVTIRTMISEHSTPKTQARSFSWFAFAGNLGLLFGPLIGGALADPATIYPRLFGNVAFFKDYPYALPSFAVGAIGFTAVITTALFVDETLKKPQHSPGHAAENGQSSNGAGTKLAPKSTWQLLKSPGVAMVLFSYGHVMILAFAYTAVVTVFWYTPVPLGGLGLSSIQISMFMATTGFSQAFWLLVVFPPLQHRLGTNGVMRLCGIAYPIAMSCNPILSTLLRSGAETAFWIIAPVFLLIAPGVSMAFTGIQLALNDISPSPETLGTLNALALTGSSALRSFSPALSTTIFAVGVRSQIFWGHLFWLIIVIIAAAYTFAVRYLPAASEKDYPDEDRGDSIRQAEAAAATDDEETLRGD